MSDRPAPPERRPSDAEVARAAVVHAVASNLAMLAVLVAVNVAVAKRDTITRGARRAVGLVRHSAEQARIAGEVASFARDVAEISHLHPDRRAHEP